MPELHLSFSFHLFFLLLVAVCAIAGAMVVYRITVPPVSSVKRIILISLRSVGLFLLILLIGEPLLSLISHSIDQPLVAVLIDNSQSMAIHERTKSPDASLKSIFRSDIKQQIGKEGRITYTLFDGKVRNLTTFTEDSLTLSGEATNIAEALKSTRRIYASSNLQAVVLITDGNSTVGMNPLYEAGDLGVPIFTVGVGDTSEQKDLLIRKVLTNEITYVGTKVPVHVTVHSLGCNGERAQVSLYKGTKKIDDKLLVLERGTRDYLVSFSFTPEEEGIQKFLVEISHLPGELTTQNNRMSFFTKVLKSKLHVALLAGAPSQDVAFIRRALTNDKNIELKTFIERNDGQFYENVLTAQALRETDCLVLAGFPMKQTQPRTLQAVLEATDADKPLFMVLSKTMDFEKLRTLDQVLPFNIGSVMSTELQVFTAVPEAQRNNPILRIDQGTQTVELWSKLPPIFRLQGTYRSKIESEILATIRLQSTMLNDPLIVARNVNKKKSLSVLGYGLWRWNMLSDAGSGTAQVLEGFAGNAIRWLTTQEDARQIRVQPSKNIYTTQEAVEFSAQVYNNNYQPIEDAQIEVRAQHGGEMNPMTLQSLGSGQYHGAYERLQEGDYKFTATVTLNGTTIGSDKGTFSIGGLNVEYLETRLNKPLLQQIATQTGGKYYEVHEFHSLPRDIMMLPNFISQDISRSTEIEIWNSRWMLALVILVFAFEWFIRKRNGML